ncbi:MAG: hydroxyacid dehydrogenase, partial [Candidatus Marinimicrobia bacterium]|nr:hydroxyacid dehydrogenase [Candidatus Neomarinimicrobiota bacterium]
ELRAKDRLDFTLNFWRENVDKILDLNNKMILKHSGKITNSEMEKLVRNVYDNFDTKRKRYDAQLADQDDLDTLTQAEEKIKKSS